mmetsp:Transcript_61565/g.181943  ORF Transcript_61565/g.181943 Transcript_61565/m.181943 type:complete len:206 (+) Transcript_61565:239-856(+)
MSCGRSHSGWRRWTVFDAPTVRSVRHAAAPRGSGRYFAEFGDTTNGGQKTSSDAFRALFVRRTRWTSFRLGGSDFKYPPEQRLHLRHLVGNRHPRYGDAIAHREGGGGEGRRRTHLPHARRARRILFEARRCEQLGNVTDLVPAASPASFGGDAAGRGVHRSGPRRVGVSNSVGRNPAAAHASEQGRHVADLLPHSDLLPHIPAV